jgi:hypothetical protein
MAPTGSNAFKPAAESAAALAYRTLQKEASSNAHFDSLPGGGVTVGPISGTRNVASFCLSVQYCSVLLFGLGIGVQGAGCRVQDS